MSHHFGIHSFYSFLNVCANGVILCRLEEIGAAAAKEYSLEKAMEKMKVEWKDMTFEFIAYRDSVSTK